MWAGYLAEAAETPDTGSLRDLLGAAAEIRAGAGCAVGVRPGGPDDARLEAGEGGKISVSVEVNGERAIVASIRPGPPFAAVTLTPDLFGMRSCYVSVIPGARGFASDLDLLLHGRSRPSPASSAALHGYLCFSYVPSPRSMAGYVFTVPAGSRWTATPSGCHLEADDPWQEGERSRLAEDEAARALRVLLREAVARRLPAGEEVGLFLSGGLDSSLIAALLVEAGARPRLFTLDFGPPYDVELPRARRVAEHLGCPLHVVPARPARVREALRPTAAALARPFGDPVTTPLYLLGKAASDHVGVIFNGEGGDQLFGGWANKPMVAALLYGGGQDRLEAYLATYHRFYGETDRLYTKAARAETAGIDLRAWLARALAPGRFASLLHWLRAANLRLKGAQNIAPRAVQLAEAHGLRMRAPFFDRALSEWSFTLPPEWLLQGACEKAILKRVAAEYLPPEIVGQEKRGMGVPATEWCLGALRHDVARVLSPARMRREGRFDPAAVAALRRGEDRESEFRRRRAGEKLWTLLMLHLWADARPGIRLGL